MNILNIYIVFLISGAFAAPAPIPARPAVVSSTAAARGADSGPAAPLVKAASKALEAGNYQEAAKLAAEALKADPGNREAATVLHFAAGRGAAVSTSGAAKPSTVALQTSVPPVIDSRPGRLSIKVPGKTSVVPDIPADGEPRMYLPPGKSKPPFYKRWWNNYLTIKAGLERSQSDADRARLAALRNSLNATESGRAVVASLGGWKEIEKKIDLRMANLPSGYGGFAVPLMRGDSDGHSAMLLMARDAGNDPDAVTVSIFAHELGHVNDFARGERTPGLRIPNELAAHRLQVHVFLEQSARMTPAQRKSLAGEYGWEYSNFISALWVDHILEKYQDADGFVSQFVSDDLQKMARSAYLDLQAAHVKPGGPQLDYHLTAANGGLYTTLTDEKDILDIVQKERLDGVTPTTEQQEELKRREALISRVEAQDEAYRRAHGYQLDGAR